MPGIRINVPPAEIVGSAKESVGVVPLTEKTPPVMAEVPVLINANRIPSDATEGLLDNAVSIAPFPVF
jgi:hypothetical protein